MNIRRSIFFGTILAVGIVILPRPVFAARLSIVPGIIHAAVGDVVSVDLILDTENESINAVDLNLIYPALVTMKSVSKNHSILSLWVDEPSFTRDTISVRGGIPGGIKISHGVLATITFQANAVGQGTLVYNASSLVLRNDGLGSSADITASALTIDIQPRTASLSATPGSVNAHVVRRPSSFSIQIGQDDAVLGGKYFASFYTSGIDHYEIQEGRGVFQIARNPYLLSDQHLHSVIHVRAYDSNGNWTQVTWPNVFTRIWWWIIGMFGFH